MKKLLMSVLAVMLICTDCSGGGSSMEQGTAKSEVNSFSNAVEGGAYDSDYESNSGEITNNTDIADNTSSSSGDTQQDTNEMLVYRGSFVIDTLEFNKSVESLDKMIKDAGGFIENETFSDGGDIYSYYYMEDNEKKRTYNGTIRVPSDKYESFTDSLDDLGDVRKHNSSVDNITTQYNQMKAKLDILTSKRDRYLKLLKNAKDDNTAIQLESELTNLEVQISDITNSISDVDMSVAYSYIDITLQAVKKYSQRTTTEDSFGQELLKAIRDSFDGFVDWVQGIIISLVYALPYLIVYAVIIIGLVAFTTKRRRKKNLKKNEKNAS